MVDAFTNLMWKSKICRKQVKSRVFVLHLSITYVFNVSSPIIKSNFYYMGCFEYICEVLSLKTKRLKCCYSFHSLTSYVCLNQNLGTKKRRSNAMLIEKKVVYKGIQICNDAVEYDEVRF